MDEVELQNLKRYIAEEMCHHKYDEQAVEYNATTGAFDFTPHSEHFIELEINSLDVIFESYGCVPKLSLTEKIWKWLKIQ